MEILGDLRVWQKSLLPLVFFAVGAILLTFVLLSSMASSDRQYRDLVTMNASAGVEASRANSEVIELAALGYQLAAETRSPIASALREKIASLRSTYQGNLDRIRQSFASSADIANRIHRLQSEFLEASEVILKIGAPGGPSPASGDVQTLGVMEREFKPIAAHLDSDSEALLESVVEKIEDRSNTLSALSGQTRRNSIVVACIFIPLFLVVADWINFVGLVRPIRVLTVAMCRLSGRHWATLIPYASRGDEIGEMARALEIFKNSGIEADRLAEAQKADQAALLEAEKLAALGRLVAGVAHELNTPVGSALTMVSTLEQLSAEFSKQVTTNAIRRQDLNKFITDVADASRVSSQSLRRAAELIGNFKQVAADQASMQRRSYDLGEVVEQIITSLRPFHRSAQVEIISEIPRGIVMQGYPGALTQVITNLVNNAVTHGLEGVSDARVTIAVEHAEAKYVTILVSDNGKGMSEDVQAHAFDPFYTTKLGQGGTGLGLPIVHNLVVGPLGGRIRVESTVGDGTTVTVRIPRAAPVSLVREADHVG